MWVSRVLALRAWETQVSPASVSPAWESTESLWAAMASPVSGCLVLVSLESVLVSRRSLSFQTTLLAGEWLNWAGPCMCAGRSV